MMGEGALTADDFGFEHNRSVNRHNAYHVIRMPGDAPDPQEVARATAERQDFIDRAVIAMMAQVADLALDVENMPIDAGYVFDWAEALWAERERRRGK